MVQEHKVVVHEVDEPNDLAHFFDLDGLVSRAKLQEDNYA
jgi:hypothetical protein